LIPAPCSYTDAMNRVGIVIDSSACLPAELAERYGIEIVPLGLLIGGEVFPDGSLTSDDLFARVERANERAQTTSPAPGEFLAAFRRVIERGAEQVLCLTLSAEYSGTYNAAVSAAGIARGEGIDARMVDTGGLAMTHGFAVLAAARAGEGVGGIDDAAAEAQRVGSAGRLVGSLDTLRYLVKSGRVPWIVGWAAALLRIRPVLAFEDGSARSIARPRTWLAARERMLREMANGAGERPLRVAVMHTAAPDRAAELAEAVCERFRPAELLLTEFTSVMAVHTGPGFVGLAFYED